MFAHGLVVASWSSWKKDVRNRLKDLEHHALEQLSFNAFRHAMTSSATRLMERDNMRFGKTNADIDYLGVMMNIPVDGSQIEWQLRFGETHQIFALNNASLPLLPFEETMVTQCDIPFTHDHCRLPETVFEIVLLFLMGQKLSRPVD